MIFQLSNTVLNFDCKPYKKHRFSAPFVALILSVKILIFYTVEVIKFSLSENIIANFTTMFFSQAST